MGLQRRSIQRFNSPASPDPLPLAPDEPQELMTECPACKISIRPGAVLCINCGARLGRIDTVAPAGAALRAPCPNCGYDLSGIEGTTCPDCGGHAPFVAPDLDDEGPMSLAERLGLEHFIRPAGALLVGLAVLTAIAGAWYGSKGVLFWLALIIPAWTISSLGYFTVGAMMRFLDTTVPITLAQVLAVTVLGLAATELMFPFDGQVIRLWSGPFVFVPSIVTIATMILMDDDDRWNSFFASLPISLTCMITPYVLLSIV